jgi:hypothetical protein
MLLEETRALEFEITSADIDLHAPCMTHVCKYGDVPPHSEHLHSRIECSQGRFRSRRQLDVTPRKVPEIEADQPADTASQKSVFTTCLLTF